MPANVKSISKSDSAKAQEIQTLPRPLKRKRHEELGNGALDNDITDDEREDDQPKNTSKKKRLTKTQSMAVKQKSKKQTKAIAKGKAAPKPKAGRFLCLVLVFSYLVSP